MPKPKRKLYLILIILISILFLSALYFFISMPSQTQTANLHIESGTVLLNKQTITLDQELSENDEIETLQNSLASIILYDSIIINLEPNTKIIISSLLKEHPRIEQEKGTTFNTITGLFGINSYTSSSSDAVASVRGTSFEFSNKKIIVSTGKVDFTLNNQKFTPTQNNVVEEIRGNIIQRPLNQEETNKIIQYNERTISILKSLITNTEDSQKLSVLREKIEIIDFQTKKLTSSLSRTNSIPDSQPNQDFTPTISSSNSDTSRDESAITGSAISQQTDELPDIDGAELSTSPTNNEAPPSSAVPSPKPNSDDRVNKIALSPDINLVSEIQQNDPNDDNSNINNEISRNTNTAE
jgi:hypothetical protein